MDILCKAIHKKEITLIQSGSALKKVILSELLECIDAGETWFGEPIHAENVLVVGTPYDLRHSIGFARSRYGPENNIAYSLLKTGYTISDLFGSVFLSPSPPDTIIVAPDLIKHVTKKKETEELVRIFNTLIKSFGATIILLDTFSFGRPSKRMKEHANKTMILRPSAQQNVDDCSFAIDVECEMFDKSLDKSWVLEEKQKIDFNKYINRGDAR